MAKTNQPIVDDVKTGVAVPSSPDPVTPKPASPAGPAPNIKFVGRQEWDKGKHKVLKDPQPQTSFSDRGEIVKLPSADFQKTRRLFYHENATQIIQAFPHLYKRIPKRKVEGK